MKHKTYRNIKYTHTVLKTWDGVLFDNYSCNDRVILDGLDTSLFTKLTEQAMKDEIDRLIDKRKDLLQIQDLVHEARRDWYANSYSGKYTGD
tara:strand:+ start:900 stop:1175 length:276 start_codon:yes stop_codon:yes gene_type:complete